LEQTVEVVAAHGPVLAAVLEQEARKRCLQQAVLVSIGMAADEFPHRLVQILRELIDDAHVDRQVAWDLAHAFITAVHPSSNEHRSGVKAAKPVRQGRVSP
jgi:hypothetical protein